MKNVKLLLIVIFLLFYTAIFAQNTILNTEISISFDNITLRSALKQLESRSSAGFTFNNNMDELDQIRDATFNNTTIQKILDALLRETNLKYKIADEQIVIFHENNQPKGTILGRVVNSNTGEFLHHANIIIEGTNIGASSDSGGNFQIKGLIDGSYNLLISYIGFKPIRIENVKIENGNIIDLKRVLLEQNAITLKDVIVSPGSFSVMGDLPLSRQTLAEKDIKNMSFAEDITRAVSRLPGVSSNDFSSKFTVRGGEADEVLITLDGMELYEPFHQRDYSGGLFSIVDIEAIQGIDLLTGGFSAEYGDRQSGVFNMRTKKVQDNNSNTSVGLSVMNARVYTDGKFANNNGNYLFTARRGMLDASFKLIGEEENTPSFYDTMLKLDYAINPKHTLSLHMLHAGDKTKVRDISEEAHDIHDTQYNNSYSWITLNSIYNPKLSSRTLLFVGLITHERNGDTEKWEPSDKLFFILKDKRSYNFVGIKQDWNWEIYEKLILKSGFDVRQLNADYDYSLTLRDIRVNSDGNVGEISNNVAIQQTPSGQKLGAYITGKILVASNLYLETGLRYDYVSYTNDNLISPRISLAYAFSNGTFLRGAWGQYYQSQFINNLDVNHNTESFNRAEMAEHSVLGLEHIFNNGLTFRLEGYHKDISLPTINYQNLRDPWEVYPESRNDVAKINISKARANGIELFLKYDVGGKFSYWFSYALARAEEKVDSIEFDGLLTHQTGWLPRINNQTHTVYVDVNYRPKDEWVFNLSWQFYKGWPNTLYEYNFTELDGGDIHFYPRHTEFRGDDYPPYHRMDFRINRRFDLILGQINAFVHIINVYNRENLRKFDLDVRNDKDEYVPDGKGGYLYPRDDKNWFGLIPAIGFSWEF